MNREVRGKKAGKMFEGIERGTKFRSREEREGNFKD
jgi:hypothetical protein